MPSLTLILGALKMGVLAVSWAFRQRISGNEKVVLLAIADHADDDGKCWPSIPLIAEKACVSERTVQRILVNLEADNLVKRVARSDRDGRKTANLYVLAMDTNHGDKVSPSADRSDSSVTGDGDNYVTEDGDNCVTSLKRTIIRNHHKEPSNILAGSDFEAEFSEFWAAYPKRLGNPKHKAFVEYVNARKSLKVSKEEILQAAKGYAVLCRGKNNEYIKWAMYWLKERRWLDDYTLDGGANCPEPQMEAAEKWLDEIVAVYPGHVGDRAEAAKLIAVELSKGVQGKDLWDAARKYTLFCKGPPYEDRKITPAMLETWLKFKWREMDGYEFCTVGPDRIRTVRPKKAAA